MAIAVQPLPSAAASALAGLVDGPLVPLDGADVVVTLPRPDFVNLVADGLDGVGGQHTRLDAAHRTITEHSVPTRINAASASVLEPATAAQAAHVDGFNQADPSDVIDHLNGLGPALDVSASAFTDPPPADFPVLIIPPPPSGGGGGDGDGSGKD